MNIFFAHLRNLTFGNRADRRSYLNRREVCFDSFIIELGYIEKISE